VLCCGGCVGKASRDMAGYEWCVTTCACFWRGCEDVVLIVQCLDPSMSFLPLPLPSVGWPAASILSGGGRWPTGRCLSGRGHSGRSTPPVGEKNGDLGLWNSGF
jgi:hypothetical protein